MKYTQDELDKVITGITIGCYAELGLPLTDKNVLKQIKEVVNILKQSGAADTYNSIVSGALYEGG